LDTEAELTHDTEVTMSQADAHPTTPIALLPLIRNKNRLPPGKTDHFWPDHGEGSETGFSLRVRLKSSGAFLNNWYHGRRGAGRKELGRADVVAESAARKAARKINARIELGEDVGAEREEKRAAGRWTLKAFLTEYCDHKANTLKPSSLAALRHYLLGRDEPGKCRNLRSRGMIKSYLAPWHNKPAAQFTRTHASEAIAKCEANSGKPSAGQLRSNLSAALAWGLREGRFGLKENVVINARLVEGDGQPTGRVFTDDELKLIWDHAPEGHARAVVRLLILTACRRAEVGNMEWPELKPNGTWAIPLERLKNAKTRTKFGFGAHTLKVTPMMHEIIDCVHQRAGRDQLFGSRGKGFTMWSETKERLDEVIDGDWSFHDIRRSVASRLGDLEVPPYVIEMLLGHIAGGIISTYNKSSYQKQLDSVIELWHGHVAELVGWTPPGDPRRWANEGDADAIARSVDDAQHKPI